MIEAENLCYRYDEEGEDGKNRSVPALDSLNLKIRSGEYVAVLGHNGSGKSTFAKLINGLILPSSGVIRVGGLDTTSEEMMYRVRQLAGMVFQNPDNQIIGAMVEEDVGFGPENLQVPTEEIRERVDAALAAVGMTEHRKASPNRLSGGQKQRVAIAGVLAMRPQCIVLDEPTAMLDPIGRREVIETVSRLNKEAGVTIVLITHFMEEVVDADRVIVMDEGRVVMDGTPQDVFMEEETLQSIGLDVPDITALSLALRRAGMDMPVTFDVASFLAAMDKMKK
ncbi:MAG: energy-coupling factor transporter ATPase [Eubacteriales bacterium]|nr:energy-coupling factor transporter ATPase [Eubacteriales bacterium]